MVVDEVESKMIGVCVGNRDEVCEMAVRGMIAQIEDKTGGELFKPLQAPSCPRNGLSCVG
jgi:hypothetical protein